MDDLAFGDDDEIEPEHYRLFDQIQARSLSERIINNSSSHSSIQESFHDSHQSLPGAVPPPPPPPPPPTSSAVPPPASRPPLSATTCPSPQVSMPKVSAAEQHLSELPFPTDAAPALGGQSLTGTEIYRSMSPLYSGATTNNKANNVASSPHRSIPSSTSSSPSLALGRKLNSGMDNSFASSSAAAAATTAAGAAAIPPPTENQRQSSFYLSLLVHAEQEAKEKGGTTATTNTASNPHFSSQEDHAAAAAAMPNFQSSYPAGHQHSQSRGSNVSFSDNSLDNPQRRRSSYLDRKPSAKKINIHEYEQNHMQQQHLVDETMVGASKKERASSWAASDVMDSTFASFSSAAVTSGATATAASSGRGDVQNDRGANHDPNALLYPESGQTKGSQMKSVNFSKNPQSTTTTAEAPLPTDLGRQSSFYRSLLESANATADNNNCSGEEAVPPPPEKTVRQSSFYLSLLASAAEENPNAASQHISSVPASHPQAPSSSTPSSGNNDVVTDMFIDQMKKLHFSKQGGSSGNNADVNDLAGTGVGGEMDAIPPPVDGVNRQSSFYLSLFAPPSDTTIGGPPGIGENASDVAMKLPPPQSTIDDRTSAPPPTMLTSRNSLTVDEIMAIAAATERADAEDLVKAAKMGSVSEEKSSSNRNSNSIPMVNAGDNNNNIDVRLVGQTIDAEQYNEQIAILTKIQEEREAEQRTLLKLQNDEEEEVRKKNLLQVGANHQNMGSSGLGGGTDINRSSAAGGPPTTTTTNNRTNNSSSDLSMNTDLLMKGNRETWEAIAAGEAHVVTCLGCRGKMQVAKSASLVFCPICRTVSPNKTSLSRGTSLNPDDEEAFNQMDESVSDALQRQEYLAVLRSRGADISNTVPCRELDESVMDKVHRKLQKYNSNSTTSKEAERTVERKLDMYNTNRQAEHRVEQKLNMYRENRDVDKKVEQKLNHYAEQKRKNNRGDNDED